MILDHHSNQLIRFEGQVHTKKKNSLNEHKNKIKIMERTINLLYFSIMQLCYSNLMYLRWVNFIQ